MRFNSGQVRIQRDAIAGFDGVYVAPRDDEAYPRQIRRVLRLVSRIFLAHQDEEVVLFGFIMPKKVVSVPARKLR